MSRCGTKTQGTLLVSLALAIACGGAMKSESSAGGGAAAPDAYAAPHPACPQLVDQGGPILTAPSVVTVTFRGDANAAQLAAFGAQVTNNPWWDAVRQGYCESGTDTCIGDGPAGASVELTSAPDAKYTASSQGGPSTFQTWVRSLIADGRVPKPDAQTILAFYFPSTTTITLDGEDSCVVFAGYHNSMSAGGVQFMYVVVSDCPAAPGYVGPTQT